MEESEIQRTIVQRLDSFNRQKYNHEQINRHSLVRIVPRGILPRTAVSCLSAVL